MDDARVRQVEFAGAIGAPGQVPPGQLPQVAVAGRSNCGKSSLINKLVGRKKLARVSQVPGKTREINFYLINDRFFLTDLPGYGFARAPEAAREHWHMLIERFLANSTDLAGIIVLIDARRGVQPQDQQLLAWLSEYQIPALFALTKIDKLNRSGRKSAEAALQKDLDLQADQVIATSAHSGEGVDTLRESLFALVDSYSTEAV
ncbi:MAG: YihA family ribosome biogenesis GTP-binding protein [Gemmatimonadales bacterium]|nr:MAG: YihA family ribosome biogenesis GTP-binding protein [Gemmatimonadales bacterium]